MSNSNSKKTSRKLSLSIQTVHTTASRSSQSYSPTATCIGCATFDCLTLFIKN